MANATLKIFPFDDEPREMKISGGVVSFGRGADNSVAFADDSNVSRHHAEIETRGENFYVVDLESRNGTSVNREHINGEQRLRDGDAINFGGESRVEFYQSSEKADGQASANGGETATKKTENIASAETQTAAAPLAKSNLPLILAGATLLLMVLIIVGVGGVLAYRSVAASRCAGTVEILSPSNGDTVADSFDIKIRATNVNCIERVEYRIDDEAIATAQTAPFTVTLDGADVQKFADQNSHILTAAVVSRNGTLKVQNGEVLLGFENSKTAAKLADSQLADSTPKVSATNIDVAAPIAQTAAQVSLSDVKTMSETFIKKFSGNFAYTLDPQFLRAVQGLTGEYRVAGFYQKAANYQDQINVAFIGEQDLDPPLGYVLAMSRSKFDNKKNGNLEGLWQISGEMAAANGYNGQCGAETLSDAAQNCAARTAAIYTKAIVVNLFQGDVVYGVSCFGMSPAEAGRWKITLPENRANFWNVIKSAKQRDALARFFAAAIVAENPQKFDLKRDKPLSDFYKK